MLGVVLGGVFSLSKPVLIHHTFHLSRLLPEHAVQMQRHLLRLEELSFDRIIFWLAYLLVLELVLGYNHPNVLRKPSLRQVLACLRCLGGVQLPIEGLNMAHFSVLVDRNNLKNISSVWIDGQGGHILDILNILYRKELHWRRL